MFYGYFFGDIHPLASAIVRLNPPTVAHFHPRGSRRVRQVPHLSACAARRGRCRSGLLRSSAAERQRKAGAVAAPSVRRRRAIVAQQNLG